MNEPQFGCRDQLRALCAPVLCCCASARPDRDDSDVNNFDDHEGAWSAAADAEPRQPAWDTLAPGSARADARDDDVDAMSLHSNVGASSRRPRQARRRGRGDISGGGDTEGSGLSRWTLLKSWFATSRTGRIRLPDGELEEEPTAFGLGDEAEEDAMSISEDTLIGGSAKVVSRPPEPQAAPSTSSDASSGSSSRHRRRRSKRQFYTAEETAGTQSVPRPGDAHDHAAEGEGQWMVDANGRQFWVVPVHAQQDHPPQYSETDAPEPVGKKT